MFGLSESVFLCRWHSGPSHEEPGWTAEDAIWMWRAEHSTSGPQHLYPSVPEKHKAADPSHRGKGYQIPDQWWVSDGFILQPKIKHLQPSDMPNTPSVSIRCWLHKSRRSDRELAITQDRDLCCMSFLFLPSFPVVPLLWGRKFPTMFF